MDLEKASEEPKATESESTDSDQSQPTRQTVVDVENSESGEVGQKSIATSNSIPLCRFKAAATKILKQRKTVNSIGDSPVGVAPGVCVDNPPKYIENCHTDVSIQIVDYNEKKVTTNTMDNNNLENFLSINRPAHSKVRWINCSGISFDVIRTLGQKYDLHPLAVEDIFHIPQRVKVDFFEEHVFVSMSLVKLYNEKSDPMNIQSIILFHDHQKLLKQAGGRMKDLLKFPRPVAEMEQCYIFFLSNNVMISIFQHQGQGIREGINTRLQGFTN
jgi:hypothetical protein